MRRPPKPLAVLPAVLIALAACSTRRPDVAPTGSAHAAPAAAGAIEQGAVSVDATVVRVDAKRRLVTLETADGRRVTARVHGSVNDLERVQAGDTVRATYYESVAYEVKKPGTAVRGVSVAEESGAAKPGRLPAAVDARAVTVIATVGAVNPQHGTVTLQAPDADPVTIRVKDTTALRQLARGDLVEITYTEALAVAVERAK